MLECEALQLIQNTAVDAAGVKPFATTGIPAAVIPKGLALSSIEHLQAGRARFRGTFSTAQAVEFNAYTTRRAESMVDGDETKVFIETDEGAATAFFNLGDHVSAGHGDDIARLMLKETPAYASLKGIAGKKQSQRSMAEWLEDWPDILTPLVGDEAEPMTVAKAIAAVRDITITASSDASHVVADMSSSRSSMDQVAAKSRVVLPAGFSFYAAPYEGFTERHWMLRLAVIPGDPPVLVLRIVGFEAMKERIAREFEEIVRNGVPDDVAIYRGHFKP